MNKAALITASATLYPFSLAHGSSRRTEGSRGSATDARSEANIERGRGPKKRAAAVVPSGRVRKKLCTAVRALPRFW